MKIGDKVTLKSYIEFNHDDAPGIVREMFKFFGGKEVTITELYAEMFEINEDDGYTYRISWIDTVIAA